MCLMKHLLAMWTTVRNLFMLPYGRTNNDNSAVSFLDLENYTWSCHRMSLWLIGMNNTGDIN